MKCGVEANLASVLCQARHVVIDEISMVGSIFFWKINQHLKELMGCNDYFGGLNVIATGDFHQLPPVENQWVFKRTKIRGRCYTTANNIAKHILRCTN